MQEFGDHPNIVKLLNVIRAQNDKDIYLIFEYMGEFWRLQNWTTVHTVHSSDIIYVGTELDQ